MGPKAISTIILLMNLVLTNTAHSAMSSTNYQIQWDSVGTGGSDSASSSSYQLRDTVGNSAIDNGSSATYQLRSGYRQGVNDQFISFSLVIQNNDSQTTASSVTGTSITTGSTSGFSVGDYVLLVQDLGASQVSAFGKILSVSGAVITLDSFTVGSSSPTIDGTNDYVFRLTTSATPTFGSLSVLAVSTTTFGWEVTSISQNGHTVFVYDDGNLRSGASDIDDVTDGTVTVGAEEYGARSSDATLSTSTFDTQDTAITTSSQAVGTESSRAYNARQFLTLKASITPSTVSGTYTNSTVVIATGNF